ncbi:hypothetical protein HDV62DRAFT_331101 [Trichoderma sp. SZMC 28011]
MHETKSGGAGCLFYPFAVSLLYSYFNFFVFLHMGWRLVTSPCFNLVSQAPLFFLFCFFQLFPHQLTFDLFSGRWPLIVIAPDCMLLIPHLLVFIYSHSKALFKLHCNMESVLFYWNVKKKRVVIGPFCFPLSSCFSSSSSSRFTAY